MAHQPLPSQNHLSSLLPCRSLCFDEIYFLTGFSRPRNHRHHRNPQHPLARTAAHNRSHKDQTLHRSVFLPGYHRGDPVIASTRSGSDLSDQEEEAV